jgi:hypothetical protein
MLTVIAGGSTLPLPLVKSTAWKPTFAGGAIAAGSCARTACCQTRTAMTGAARRRAIENPKSSHRIARAGPPAIVAVSFTTFESRITF